MSWLHLEIRLFRFLNTLSFYLVDAQKQMFKIFLKIKYHGVWYVGVFGRVISTEQQVLRTTFTRAVSIYSLFAFQNTNLFVLGELSAYRSSRLQFLTANKLQIISCYSF